MNFHAKDRTRGWAIKLERGFAGKRLVINEPKIPGATIAPKFVPRVSKDVRASWTWNNQGQGLVQWTFTNSNAAATKSVVLLRNGYFFGAAFWPVYEANSGFDDPFTSQLVPLPDKGVNSNQPPLGILDFPDGKREVCFIFTLGPNETWSMIEGGFSLAMTPSGIGLYNVNPKSSGQYCIKYDAKRVSDWDSQTGTNLKGYSPNPSAFTIVEVTSESDTPDDQLPYSDSIVNGPCK